MNTIKDPILAQVDESMIGGLIRSKDDIGGFHQRFPEFRINKLTWPSDDTYTGVVEHEKTGRQFKIEVTPDAKKVDEIAPYTPATVNPQPIQYNSEAQNTEQSDWRTIILSAAVLIIAVIAVVYFFL